MSTYPATNDVRHGLFHDIPTSGINDPATRWTPRDIGIFFGIAGHDDDIDDFTPGGYEAHSQLRRRTLAALAETTPIDDIDKVTLAAMRERLGLAEETYAAGIDEMAVNVLASPAQEVRDVFDLMPTNDDGEWSVFGTRLAKVPRALDQWLGTTWIVAIGILLGTAVAMLTIWVRYGTGGHQDATASTGRPGPDDVNDAPDASPQEDSP